MHASRALIRCKVSASSIAKLAVDRPDTHLGADLNGKWGMEWLCVGICERAREMKKSLALLLCVMVTFPLVENSLRIIDMFGVECDLCMVGILFVVWGDRLKIVYRRLSKASSADSPCHVTCMLRPAPYASLCCKVTSMSSSK